MVSAQEERFPIRIPLSLGGLTFLLRTLGEPIYIPPHVLLAFSTQCNLHNCSAIFLSILLIGQHYSNEWTCITKSEDVD